MPFLLISQIICISLSISLNSWIHGLEEESSFFIRYPAQIRYMSLNAYYNRNLSLDLSPKQVT